MIASHGSRGHLSRRRPSPDLFVNENTLPAFTLNGFTRPELHLNAGGQILLDDTTSAFAAKYGLEYLYLGVPPGTPYPPVDLS